jgi:predicted O-methyltransferase YrrM
MGQDRWSAVDDYIVEQLLCDDDAPESVLAANVAAGLPEIDVSPAQGKLLHLLVRMTGARRVLEIGTLGGYSTIWLASALPADGLVVTLEAQPKHAEVARANIARLELSDRVEVRVGPALDTLPLLQGEGLDPFDLVFIDADKENNGAYLDCALKLSRPGTVIVVDNVVRGGAVVDVTNDDPDVRGTQELFEMLGEESRVSATAIQTVGNKGWDGFIVAVVGPKLR